MREKRNPSALTGIAGVHYAVSELSRRGMIALPTIRNTAGYDIIVVSPDGRRHANIQVKSSSKRVNFWPMPPSQKLRVGSQDFYVFLRWLKRENQFEGFMVRGSEARGEVKLNENRQLRGMKRKTRRKLFPAFHVYGFRDNPRRERERERRVRRWKETWEKWKL